ncbi:MAG: hypothetical protein ACI97A_002012 [Planctomycetota bacterium]|jgi:hypothetical protein
MSVKRAERMKATDSELVGHRAAVDSWFKKNPMVTIDGVVVEPQVGGFKFITVTDHELKIDYVEVDLAFSVKAKPKRLLLTWTEFEIFPDWPMAGVDALFAWDDEQIALGFYPDEPEFMWHAPAKKAVKAVLPVPPPAPPRITLPLVSLACLAGLLFFVPLSYFMKLGIKIRWGGIAVLLIFAVGLQGQMQRSVRPFWLEAAKLPTEVEAQEIFAVLQQNTYRAFDHKEEGKIYDVLARSIDGPLLERIYGEILESLILRQDGGAICKVRKVEILKCRVEMGDDPETREFSVRAKWRVIGRVGHYGHEHIRAIQYQARYLLREREEGWRISAVEILNQRRLDPEKLGLKK